MMGHEKLGTVPITPVRDPWWSLGLDWGIG